MEPTDVLDDESFYRAIRANDDEFTFVDGELKFSQMAFRDVASKPSGDRSSIRSDPRESKVSPTDGVTALPVKDIRDVRSIRVRPNDKDVSGKEHCYYTVDVIHRPIKDQLGLSNNAAHCQVECDPSFEVRNHFKKLQNALALIADKYGFVVNPASPD